MDRRDFFKWGGSSLISMSLNKDGLLSVAQAVPTNGLSSNLIEVRDPNPLQTLRWDQWSSLDFNGDEIERTHEALWNREGYIAQRGGLPAVSEHVDTVIVGGGLSGLLSAHFLRHRQPILLEQAPQFGGNSRGEIFPNQSAFSIGAAYITRPEESSFAANVLQELGLSQAARHETAGEAQIFFKGEFFREFWNGSTDPLAHEQFQQVYQQLRWILDHQYPDIPWTSESAITHEQYLSLDQLSFYDWLHATFGSLHPHLLEYFQLYCWSSFAGSIQELSALQALNFLAAETDEVLAFPGGNATIAQALYNEHYKTMGSQALRAGHLVLDVCLEDDGVRVCYETPQRVLKTLKANYCIVAAPKFVAQRIVTSMSDFQRKACESILYRSYVVANVFVNTKNRKRPQAPFSPCFDLYQLEGEVPAAPTALHPPQRGMTDVCFGSWAQGDLGEFGVLTVYRPLPYQGARQFLFNPQSHDKHRGIVTSALRPLLQKLEVTEHDILGIRMTRFGHAMPLAQQGALSNGLLEQAAAPIGGRIFFANQDNWANPSFETALGEASRVAAMIR